MATPLLTRTNYTELDDADTNTGWNDLTTADADIAVEGAGSMSGIFRADGEQGYYDHGSAPVTAVGKTLRGWIFTNNIAYMGTEASDGYKLLAYDGTTTELKTIFGSDTYPGGWYNYVWDMDDFTTLTLANVQRWGVEAGHTANAKNVVNAWMDVIFYMDGYSMTGGTSSDDITPADIAAVDKNDTVNSTGAYNIFYVSPNADNVFFLTGDVQFGTGATTTYVALDGDVLTFTDLPVAAGLYSLSGVGSGTTVLIENALIQAAGTTDDTRFIFDFSDTNLLSFEMTGTRLIRAAAVDFKSGQTVTGNVFDNCGQVTAAGADLSFCEVSGYEGTADTGALDWSLATDPDTYLNDMSFTKGTASTHAIQFGDTIPTTITLRNVAFSGYNASDSQTDSTLYFADTAGTITVNLVGCSGNISYKSAGCTVNFVIDPVSLSIHVQDSDAGTDISGARVYVLAATTGNLPFEDTVTITRVTTTATVSHTAHGLATNQWVKIEGADQEDYNGAKQITKIDADSYSFTVANSPTTPATGTIEATAIIIFGTTDANGDISDTRSYTADQDFTGRIRKSSASPYYKTFNLNGTVDSATGLPLSVGMISDE